MVKWSKPAKLDLKQIHDYIAKDSKFYAQKVSQEIVDKSEILNSFPESGRIVPEIATLTYESCSFIHIASKGYALLL